MNEKMEIKIIFGIEIIFMRFCFYLKYNKFIRHKNLLIILFCKSGIKIGDCHRCDNY